MNIAIFRLQLFKPSETFIQDQVRTLPTARAMMMGRRLFGKPPAGIEYWVPEKAGVLKTAGFVAFASPALMIERLRSYRPDVVHSHFAIDGLYALGLTRKLDVPLVTTLHGFDVTMQRSQMLKSGRPALVRYALFQDRLKAGGGLFVCVSDFIREAALKAGFPESRLVRHYIGVDPEAFPAATHQDSSGPVVLQIARLVEKKGTRFLIHAFTRIAARHSDARLVIIGGGPLEGELTALAKDSAFGNRIDFLGSQPHAEVRRWVMRASVVAVPSVTAANGDAEGLPIALLEASASGVPVVGTRHAGIPEALVDGETGFLVDERSVDQLAEALSTLLGDLSMRQRFGQAGRSLVSRRFNMYQQTAALEGIYKNATG